MSDVPDSGCDTVTLFFSGWFANGIQNCIVRGGFRVNNATAQQEFRDRPAKRFLPDLMAHLHKDATMSPIDRIATLERGQYPRAATPPRSSRVRLELVDCRPGTCDPHVLAKVVEQGSLLVGHDEKLRC